MNKKRTPRKKTVDLGTKDAAKVIGGQGRPTESLSLNYTKIQF